MKIVKPCLILFLVGCFSFPPPPLDGCPPEPGSPAEQGSPAIFSFPFTLKRWPEEFRFLFECSVSCLGRCPKGHLIKCFGLLLGVLRPPALKPRGIGPKADPSPPHRDGVGRQWSGMASLAQRVPERVRNSNGVRNTYPCNRPTPEAPGPSRQK